MSKNKIIIAAFMLFLKLSTTSFGQTQLQMNTEAANKYKAADKELNKYYKLAIESVDTKQKKLLIEAQRNWIKFRDAKCVFEAARYEGGSIQPLVKSQCLEATTKIRTEDLKTIINSKM